MPHMKTIPLFLFREAPVSLSRSELLWEFANFAAAVALLAIALAAIGLFLFRRKTRDLTVIYFSLFCALYSVRLLVVLSSVRSLFEASKAVWDYLVWIITCSIILPFGLFLYQLADGRLRKLLRWLLVAQIAFAVFGIVSAGLGADLGELSVANNIVVFGTFGALTLFLLASYWRAEERRLWSHEFRVFMAGFAIWGLFVVHANLLGLRVLTGHNVEFVGFLLFVGCLGYISAYRIFANEERLLVISKELEIARRIQSSILPQGVPKLRGLDIAARYIPMSAVAGDFYDFLLVDENHVGVLVADVTGHGVPAALIASMLKVAFAGQVAQAEDPARVLSGLNAALCGKFEEHFVTAAYVYIDLEQGLMRYSGAGHPPLLRKAIGDPAKELERNGLMLGLFPEASYSSIEMPLTPGDRYLLYTDGVSEAMNGSREEFGKARLLEFLEVHEDSAADKFSEELMTRLRQWSNGSSGTGNGVQEDDVTVLVLDLSTGRPSVQSQ